MMHHRVFVILLLATLSACGNNSERHGNPVSTSAASTPVVSPSSSASLLIWPEDLLTVSTQELASGPSITGSIQPERRADLRAEVSAVVLQVLKENGDPVRRGDLLVRLDDTAIRDSLQSAEASARAAGQAYEQAERQFQRTAQLRESGMVSLQALEDVEIRRNNSQSELAVAKTNAALARQQLQRTEVRAPFDGIVSDRKVSAGDTAQIGKELLKVIDPSSMRFEGTLSADRIGEVSAGQSVSFRVYGYGERNFSGRITRVNPAANAATRQVEVLVAFTEAGQPPQLAGLYAEGRIETNGMTSLALPASAIVQEGGRSFVWRIENQALRKVGIVIASRDERSGEFLIDRGLAAGDRLLRYPTATLVAGQKVEMAPESNGLAGPARTRSAAAPSAAGR